MRLNLHHIRLLAFVALLSCVISSVAFCAQTAKDDPNRNMNASFYTNGNPYYNAGYHGQCTWYVWGRCAEVKWQINFTGDANKFYDNVQGASGKDLNPQVGDIMCLPVLDPAHGHVSFVVQVINSNSWVVDEYNINAGAPDNVQWSRETVTRDPNNSTRVKGELFGWTTLQGFVHGPTGGGGTVDPANPYVDGGYSGTQIGTAANPFKTVAQAIGAARATQSTIHVKPGTYGEKVSTSKHILFVTWGSGTVRIGG